MKAYKQLETIFNEIGMIGRIQSMLSWDASTMMPKKSAAARGEQFAYLSQLSHSKLLDPQIPDLISETSNDLEKLSDWQKVNFALMQKEIKYATCLPSDLVQALSIISNKCETVWREAKINSDFNMVEKDLTELLKLNREKANAYASEFNVKPYDALIDTYDSGRTCEDIDQYFNELQSVLPEMIDEIIEKQGQKLESNLKYPKSIQKKIEKKYLKLFGFDFNKGRLDESSHPFCGGIPEDSRITTRYNLDSFQDSFSSVVHECGHSLYERNLPKEWSNQPIGYANGFSIHESQSLFVEKQLCKNKTFLKNVYKDIIKEFKFSESDYSFETFYNEAHFIERSFIRVNADEVTYPLHIIMRYNIEKALIEGSLEAKDLPSAFNEQMKRLLNIKPKNDAEGCLQDIHWYMGAFGYFPSYAIGSITAAQIMATIKKEYNIDELVSSNNYEVILKWLNKNIHNLGSRYSSQNLIKNATGEILNVKYFIEHLRSRYL